MRGEGASTPRIRCTQREPLISLAFIGVLRIKEEGEKNERIKKEKRRKIN